jgi:hypothetical protein
MSGLIPDVGVGFPGENLTGEYRFSMFGSLADDRPKTVTLADLRMFVSEGLCAELVGRIRAEPDKARRSELKRGLPCVTISGEFAGGHKAEHLVRHSGLLCVDFDAADNPDMAGRAGEWRDRLARDEAAMLAFVSASGNGVAAVCRIEPERHAESFDALREHFRIRYGLTADRSCRDVSRLRFLSHDPGVAENPAPRIFRNYTLAAQPQPERERPGLLCAAATTLPKERREEILSALERVSPDDRQVWLDVGMAIQSEAPGLEGFNLWRVWSEMNDAAGKFDASDLDRVWGSFKRSGIGSGTLFKLAYNAGWSGAPAVLRPAGGGDGPEVVVASDWLAQPDEPERPVIHELIDCGDRVSIVGQSKARKSFYAMQLALAIATGILLLGIPTVRHRVLLVNGEIRAAPYKKRLRRMIVKMGVNPAGLDWLHVVNASDCPDSVSFDWIIAQARKHGAQVVVLDPFYLMVGDESDQVEVKQAIREVKRFAAEDMTLVMVFHAAKGRIGDRQVIDRISGSGIFARDASTMISLCEHATEADAVVVTPVTRNHPPKEPRTVRFEDGAFVQTEIAAVEKNSQTKPKRVILDDEIRACFGDKARDYSDTLFTIKTRLGIGDNRAKEILARAVSDGLVQASKEGRKTFYALRGDAV